MKKIITLVFVFLMTGCIGNGSGDEYIGKWINPNDAKRTLEISRNGENFLIKEGSPSGSSSVAAVLKEGLLEFSNGFGSVKLSYVKQNGTLLVPTLFKATEYQKVK